MSRPISKMTATFSAVIALLGANSAYAAGTAEVTTVRGSSIASAATNSDSNAFAGIVFAANSRETNLQKSPTAVVVAGIEGIRKRRVQQ